jgi:hypothetical protein
MAIFLTLSQLTPPTLKIVSTKSMPFSLKKTAMVLLKNGMTGMALSPKVTSCAVQLRWHWRHKTDSSEYVINSKKVLIPY